MQFLLMIFAVIINYRIKQIVMKIILKELWLMQNVCLYMAIGSILSFFIVNKNNITRNIFVLIGLLCFLALFVNKKNSSTGFYINNFLFFYNLF